MNKYRVCKTFEQKQKGSCQWNCEKPSALQIVAWSVAKTKSSSSIKRVFFYFMDVYFAGIKMT